MNSIHNFVIERLKLEEGWSSEPYLCTAGVKTIGYGTAYPLTEDEIAACPDGAKLPLSRCDGEQLLMLRSLPARNEVIDRLLPPYKVFFYDLPESVRATLMDMSYNIGVPRLSRFRKMLAGIKACDWAQAAEECLDSKYARTDVPERAKRNAYLLRVAGALPTLDELYEV